MTTVRLACVGTGQKYTFLENQEPPGLLVSFWYLKLFVRDRPVMHFRDWVMDSGAFSAYASGKQIDLQQYIEACKHLLSTDPQLSEVYALDVIGDWRASHKNLERMWSSGAPAIPCYHLGEPWDVLDGLARDYPKIAIGGAARMKVKQKLHFAKECFARVWPKRIHGFGFGARAFLDALPFHSVDATSWEFGPLGFKTWRRFGRLPIRGNNYSLRAEVNEYLKDEKRARHVWRREMALLDTLPTTRA